MKIYFVIGASGAGKTTAVKKLEEKMKDVHFCYFDSIGVPSNEDMIKEYGSLENWQKAKTIEWVEKIKNDYIDGWPVVLDGQIRPEFIETACGQNNINNYTVILFDCSDEVRTKRLHARNQPDLANKDMMNWAKLLRDESKNRGYDIIDTSDMSIEAMVSILEKVITKNGN